MGWDRASVPDPQDPSTFESSRLDWDEAGSGRHARILAAYRELAALRASFPELTAPTFGTASQDPATGLFTLRRGALEIHAGLGAEDVAVRLGPGRRPVFTTGSGVRFDGSVLRLAPGAGCVTVPDDRE